ncbi:MAG: glycerate kinase [Armatimonadota bacterium]|nr:MAG: glycerate kinase [Armatimonadota bacterium]
MTATGDATFLICPDSFKESLTASQAATAVRDGLSRACSGFRFHLAPISDGGEGFVEAMLSAGGRRVQACVTGPLGHPVSASYGILPDGGTAVIEMAAAAGLGLVPPEGRRPLEATTRGVGELMLDALSRGARRLLIGIGGSATTDGGAGMAQALGVRLLDAQRDEIPPGGGGLLKLDRIEMSGLDPRIRQVSIRVACDVKNPLLGERGAAAVYAPQKGATPEQVALLEQGMARLAEVARRDLGTDPSDAPGAGAAGGLGWGLMAFCGAELVPGFHLVADTLGLERRAAEADWIVTGEGRTDATSLQGKVVGGVLEIARRAERPCVILCGSVGPDCAALYQAGATAVLSIVQGPASLPEALQEAGRLVEDAAYNLGRLIAASRPEREER